MGLELGSLRKSVAALARVLERAEDTAFMSAQDEVTCDAIRAGAIQHFEFTYELCWKFMQRWISVNVGHNEAEHYRTRKDLFRLAARRGLIADPLPWFDYGDARNVTSHTYAEEKARLVYDTALRFVTDARDFLARLEGLND